MTKNDPKLQQNEAFLTIFGHMHTTAQQLPHSPVSDCWLIGHFSYAGTNNISQPLCKAKFLTLLSSSRAFSNFSFISTGVHCIGTPKSPQLKGIQPTE